MEKRFKITNIDYYRSIENQNKSILVFCAHYATYEWIIAVNNHIRHSGYAVYKKINNPYFDRLVKKIRGRFNTTLIHLHETGQIIKSNEQKNRPGTYGFVADQSPQLKKRVHWDTFMGIEVPVYTGAEILAKRFNMNVLYLKTEKIKRGYYQATFEEISTDVLATQNFEITRKFLDKVEEQIKTDPQYYLWTHKRWKHRGKKITYQTVRYMIQNIRLYEYLVFLYRIVLVYLFYFLARVLFVAFNKELLQVENFGQLMTLCLYGLKFDTTTIIYTNSLFIILSLLPIKKSTGKLYQKILFFVYFITNGVFMALNFIDFIYYRFTFSRSTINITESISNERNKSILFFNFLKDYWYIFLLFIVFIVLWVFLYKRIKVRHKNYSNNLVYYLSSIIIFLGIVPFCVAGIRGDFNHSTRPINIVDASNKVKNVAHSNVVLNTPFCIIRTISKKSFKKVNYVSEEEINRYIKPIKQYHFGEKEMNKLNVVIFIMESFSREYTGAFNSKLVSDTYNSYTPFLDSLAGHSLIFDNAYTNGVKSIHAMPAILAGIPSFKDAFTSSSYSNTESESIVSVLKNEGYKTTFFHGAPNGSMGFLGYSNILGYNYYKGLEEYGKPEDFDGTWGIWDELFFQYVKRELTVESEPFFATIFSVSSHEPFKVPAQYEGKFPKGTVPIHQCIGYSDYALKRFFEEAAKEPWFKNTLFIITADHCNQVYEKEYLKKLNRTAIPILFYLPDNNDFKGINSDWAQHIDIYPTILDLLGYDKPFRSWGRSLLNTEEVPPFAINFLNHQYQFMQGDYICTFDGQKPTGFYHKTDKDFTTNLMDQNLPEFDEMLVTCKSFIQNYFDKIVDRDLKSPVK